MRERSGGVRFVTLSFLVLGDDAVMGGAGREKEGRQKSMMGGGHPERDDLPQLVKITECCGEGGGNLRTRVEVSKGIPWIYPRERARMKGEREGQPKQR